MAGLAFGGGIGGLALTETIEAVSRCLNSSSLEVPLRGWLALRGCGLVGLSLSVSLWWSAKRSPEWIRGANPCRISGQVCLWLGLWQLSVPELLCLVAVMAPLESVAGFVMPRGWTQ